MDIQEKYKLIKNDLIGKTSKNPIELVKMIMRKEYINIHGPEHHFLDGAAFLVAFKNAGGKIDIEKALDELATRTIQMPGAMCGFWGVCGSVTAIGAALSIIHKTGPLSTNEYYKDNMQFTSRVIKQMSEIGGARCCKRNAFLSLKNGVEFVKGKYEVEMHLYDKLVCEFFPRNQQCIEKKCPFYAEKN